MGPTCRLSWWCSLSPREDPRPGHGPRPRARTPLATGTSSHSRGTSAPCSPPTPATTRGHDDTHDATNVKYYSVRSWKNKMNRRKLHDCCKTFVRGCLLALCGAWRAAVRQSAASPRSYIGPGAPMCKQEARPCFTHRCTAAPAEPAMRRSCLSTGPRGQAGHGERQHQHLSHARRWLCTSTRPQQKAACTYLEIDEGSQCRTARPKVLGST